jgi:hypothetical protein
VDAKGAGWQSRFHDPRSPRPKPNRRQVEPLCPGTKHSPNSLVLAKAGPNRSRPREQQARWVIQKRRGSLPIKRGRFRMLGPATRDRAIGRLKSHPRPSIRNNLVQQRRHGDHRALGRQPEAAQGLEMLDRPHRSLRPRRAPEPIAPTAPPEQGEQRKRFRDNQFRRCGQVLLADGLELSKLAALRVGGTSTSPELHCRTGRNKAGLLKNRRKL